LLHTQFSSKIKILRSDNSSEYMSHIMIQYLSMHDIIHQTSCIHTPQQNGIAERKNQDFLKKIRSLMF
jgi:transposase InsO family protein